MVGVGGGHGRGFRLREAEDLDLDQLDRLVDNGGEGEDAEDAASAARMRLGNRVLGPGRFGRMFRLPRFRPPDQALIELGQAMTADVPENPAQNNSNVPAGFTYLGQFIDHDITRDETEGFPPINDPQLIKQGRSVTLDLDSLYGQGPKRQPGLYNPDFPPERARFRLGTTTPVTGGPPNFNVPSILRNDLPRRPDERRTPIIGDDRNDENTIVAQTHVAFLKFHNKVMNVVNALEDDDNDGDGSATFTQAEEDSRSTQFHRAKRLVRWHYQWIVLNDFLSHLVDPDILADIKSNGRRFYDFDRAPFDGEPFMPLEFSGAAYRFGHSMIRDTYDFNRVFANPQQVPGASFPATLDLLFGFTGKGGMNGAPTLPSNWVIDWRRFFPVDDPELLNLARRFDPTLAEGLLRLIVDPGEPSVLAVRNLLRGSRLGLPTGQDVAEAMGVTPLTPFEVAPQGNQIVTPVLRRHNFDERTPLWYYVLREARLQGGGNRLGEVGSRIVGEAFFGLLEGDPNSFLSKQPDWTPTLPSAEPNDFTMSDLLKFVKDINPIG